MNAWTDSLTLARKDLLVAWRSGGGVGSAVALAGVALVVAGLAVGPDPARLRTLAPALVWITILYASIAVAERLDRTDRSDDAGVALWMVVDDRRSIFVGRVISLATMLTLLQLALWGGAAVLFDLHMSVEASALLPLTAMSALSVASAMALVQPLIADVPHRPLLLPVALLPMLVPTFLAGVQAGSALLSGGLPAAIGWTAALAIEAALFTGVGLLAFESAASPE